MATKKVARKAKAKASPSKAKQTKATAEAKAPAQPKRKSESEIRKQYPKVQAGSLAFQEDGRWKGKQTVVIVCAKKGCTLERELATSDLFQVSMCEEHTKEARAARRAERRKAKAQATASAS